MMQLWRLFKNVNTDTHVVDLVALLCFGKNVIYEVYVSFIIIGLSS